MRPPKTLFPIFHYIKIKALDNVCYLEAMDYNKNIQLQIKDTDLVVKQNGYLVIIGKHLVDIIKKIDSCSLEMRDSIRIVVYSATFIKSVLNNYIHFVFT
ncbi:MAG: hypothetical protein Q8879_02015 [Candidatus Phytoplasma australasiaticum]|nr:hypothetical protein [Candidatus Phytoplasma australasiaticum]